MKFRIWTMLWVFALLASAMATFGGWGIVLALIVLFFWRDYSQTTKESAIGWSVVCAIVLFVCALILLAAMGDVSQSARRNSCENNMQQIALALLEYEAEKGNFPPAYTTDPEGKLLHSWRVLILPYLYEKALYDAIKLDEPWDSPSNRQLWSKMPAAYRCPSCEHARKLGTYQCSSDATNYYAVVGNNTVWPGDSTVKLSEVAGKAYSLGDITTGNTLMVIETATHKHCWMEPTDLTRAEAADVLYAGQIGHLSTSVWLFSAITSSLGTHVAFVDGHTKLVASENAKDLDKDLATYLLERNGDRMVYSNEHARNILRLDVVREPKAEAFPEQFHKYLWRRVYSFAVFLLLSLLPLSKVNLSQRVFKSSLN